MFRSQAQCQSGTQTPVLSTLHLCRANTSNLPSQIISQTPFMIHPVATALLSSSIRLSLIHQTIMISIRDSPRLIPWPPQNNNCQSVNPNSANSLSFALSASLIFSASRCNISLRSILLLSLSLAASFPLFNALPLPLFDGLVAY